MASLDQARRDAEFLSEPYAPEVRTAVVELMDRGVDEVRTTQRVNCRFGIYLSPHEVMTIWRAAVQSRPPGSRPNPDGSAYHSRCSERVTHNRA